MDKTLYTNSVTYQFTAENRAYQYKGVMLDQINLQNHFISY